MRRAASTLVGVGSLVAQLALTASSAGAVTRTSGAPRVSVLTVCTETALDAAVTKGGIIDLSCPTPISLSAPLTVTGVSVSLLGLKSGQGLTSSKGLSLSSS